MEEMTGDLTLEQSIYKQIFTKSLFYCELNLRISDENEAINVEYLVKKILNMTKSFIIFDI